MSRALVVALAALLVFSTSAAAQVAGAGSKQITFAGGGTVGKDYQEFTAYSVDQNVNALFNQWGEFLRLALNAEKQTAPSK